MSPSPSPFQDPSPIQATVPSPVSAQPQPLPEVQATPPAPIVPPKPSMRSFRDIPATRKAIFDSALNAFATLPPVENNKYRLTLTDPKYVDPERFSKAQHKNAILTGGSLARRIQGTWNLIDKSTGQTIDSKTHTVASVPFLGDYGTFVLRGSDYIMRNQQRLKAGIFAREKENGELESFASIMPGQGVGHRYFLDPESGVFRMKMGQGTYPLMPLLKAMGASKEEIADAWGNDLYAANSIHDNPAVLRKLRDRLVKPGTVADGDELGAQKALVDTIAAMKLDPDTTRRTLGRSHATLTKDAILDTTRKLLAISRGEAEPDDRDDPINQNFLGPEDQFAERITKDYGRMRRDLLTKATFKGNLQSLPTNPLRRQLESALTVSGLGQPLEETNPLEILDKLSSVTRLGEGGIGDTSGVPSEARAVQAAHTGFIDLIRTPESMRAGIDLYMASAAQKGSDGSIYAPFKNVQTGQIEHLSPADLENEPFVLPGGLRGNTKYVHVFQGNRITFAPRDKVKYQMPDMDSGWSTIANLLPYKAPMKGNRVAMAARMISQSLALRDAEAPLVQAAMPGTNGQRSFDEEYGEHAGAVRAKGPGKVLEVRPDSVTVRYQDGTKDNIDLYQHHALNRKSAIHQTPTVKPGDTFDKGGLIARSNFTTPEGVTAVGLNARTAYMIGRSNFEDAIDVSESFAKRMTSEHYYQHPLEVDDRTKLGKKTYVSRYGGTFTPAQLDLLGDDGIVKPGSQVLPGQPLVLALRQDEAAHNKIHKSKQPGWKDASILWEHHDPGVVTDVVQGKNGPTVVVQTYMPMRVGDKMCFDGVTQCHSRLRGWIAFRDLQTNEEILCWDPMAKAAVYLVPQILHSFRHDGPMFRMSHTLVDMLVTLDHRCWLKDDGRADWHFKVASLLYGPRWKGMMVVGNSVSQLSEREVSFDSDTAENTIQIEDYKGMVYCPTVPTGLVVVRRGGKVHVSGNSGRYGDKSVVGSIIPDSEMPRDHDGRPYEVLANPLGINTRVNPGQKLELLMGKLAEKLGKPQKVEDFEPGVDYQDRVEQIMRQHNIPLKEDVYDPDLGRSVRNIDTGSRYWMKLMHTADSKSQARSGGGYSSDETPAKGGESGSKKMGLLNMNALVAHGAVHNQKDIRAVGGQKNENYWLDFMNGNNPRVQKVPETFKKFVHQLQASGVDVVRQGEKLNIMALTGEAVERRAEGRYIENGETVDYMKGLQPVKGGLFDRSLTGGHAGRQWSAIKLPEPMLNPVMEEPARHLLDLTEKQFNSIIAGKEKYKGYGTGARAIASALGDYNVGREIKLQRALASGTRKTYRDQANRKLRYLKHLEATEGSPADWLWNSVPVLPPNYRPVSLMQGSETPLVDDANFLYRDLIEANKVYGMMRTELGDENAGDERLAVYNAVKAVSGLGDPVGAKSQEKEVKGILKSVFGTNPKQGMIQKKLISSTIDNVGRGVIVPNPSLDMDSIGLPEDKAFDVYNRYIARRLRRTGMPLARALSEIKERSALAKNALVEEMDARPIIMNRAPVWHKMGIMAFRPRLIPGDVVHVSPLIVKGFGADFDGDAVQYHVPTLPEAVQEAYDRMLPSKNLLAPSDFKTPVHQPINEFLAGLYMATTAKKDRPARTFRSEADAFAAYRRGELDIDDEIETLED